MVCVRDLETGRKRAFLLKITLYFNSHKVTVNHIGGVMVSVLA